MAAIQYLLDGGEEAPETDTRGELTSFLTVSTEQQGLLRPSDAAGILGITPARVGQLMDSGKLASWEFFGNRYVSASHVAARVTCRPASGRPRKLELVAA
jgi:predicted XRE-type DNA-binding protein